MAALRTFGTLPKACDEDRQRRWVAALIFALAVFLVVPSFIFENNQHEIEIDFGQLCFYALIAGSVVALLLYGALSLASRWVAAAFVVAGLGLFIVAKFYILPTYVPLLDGTETFAGLSTAGGILSLLVTIAVGIVSIAAARYVPTSALRMVALVLALIGLQPLLQSKNWTLKIPETSVPKSDFVRFSTKGDVLMVVLDTVQSDVALEVLEENPKLASEWVGFDYFWNHIGKAPTTLMSMLPIYSGKEYAGGSVKQQYAGLKNDSIFSDAQAAGYGVQFVGLSFFDCFLETCLQRAVLLPVSQLDASIAEYAKLIDVGLMRVLPSPLHSWWYNNSNGRLQGLVSRQPSGFQQQSAESLRTLADQMEALERTPAIKLLHIMGAHPPIVLDGNCALVRQKRKSRDAYKALVACSLVRFTSVLQALKRIGVYDQTTIVVMADHGETVGQGRDPDKMLFGEVPVLSGRLGRFSPMMAIKLKGESHPFRINGAPSATSDLRATLCAHVFKCEAPGVDIFALASGAKRERSFIDFRLHQTDHRTLDGMPSEAYVRFSGTGHLKDFAYDPSRVPDRQRFIKKK
jgi:hypothetical protein